MEAHRDVVNVHEAKTHFSRLLARVEAGEEIVLGRSGRPIARIVPIVPTALRPRVRGGLLVTYSPEFTWDDPEMSQLFEGEGA